MSYSSYPQNETDESDTVETLIHLLPRAVNAIYQIAEANQINGCLWVRLEVHLPGGPETLRHALDIDTNPPRPEDREYPLGALPVVVLAHQVEVLRGCVVDYSEVEGQTGFFVRNPQFDGDDSWQWYEELVRQREQGTPG
jgi:Fe-S cluster assembly iron-binding protein IscA